jgi:hypothetical protein
MYVWCSPASTKGTFIALIILRGGPEQYQQAAYLEAS